MEPIMKFKSRIEGRNADVAFYADRIEWSSTSVYGRKKGSEMIPVKAISSVTTKRDGLLFTKVSVICSGNTIDFRVAHIEAGPIKDTLTALILGNHPTQQPVSTGPAVAASSPPPPPPSSDSASRGREGMDREPLLIFKSHVDGRSSDVGIYSDRLEWLRRRGVSKGKVLGGVATGGVSLLATGIKGKQAVSDMIAITAVRDVTTQPDGMYTKVSVTCSDNTVFFRVTHDDAGPIKDLVMSLVDGSHPSLQQTPDAMPIMAVTPAPSQVSADPAPKVSAPSIADELKKLADLRDAGVLTDVEFAAQKAKLLSD